MKLKFLQVAAPRKVEIGEHEFPEVPPAGQMYVKTDYLGISAGTELNAFRGGVNWYSGRDPKTRLFRQSQEIAWDYPVLLGYANTGKVTAVGKGVSKFKIGDDVFSAGRHGPVTWCSEGSVRHIPSGFDRRVFVFWQLVRTALNIVHHASINVGDTLVIFGLGPVGLISLQIAARSGAGRIACFDLIESRRKLALELGADAVFDPREADPGERIFDWNGGRGADVSLECSANVAALQQATRVVGPLGRVVLGSMPGKSEAFHFGQEVHFNGIQIRGANMTQMPPSLGFLWSMDRQAEYAAELLKELHLVDLITHQFSLSDAQRAYEFIDQNPNDVVSAIFKSDI